MNKVAVQGNQWMLFGIDMRHIGQQWLSAWRDFLFADHSPLRARLDQPVLLYRGETAELYQGGTPAESYTETECEARLLPDELVLTRELTLPLAAEAELPSVIAMEVAAGSPFTAEDTASGWCETSRDDSAMHLVLAIASRSAIRSWLQKTTGAGVTEGAGRVPEVWASAGGKMITLQGFGEAFRGAAYRRRLIRSAFMAAGVLLLFLACAALYAVQQRNALERVEALQRNIQLESESVSAMRAMLADANATLLAASEIVADYPNPHLELARLTDLLGDDSFIAHFSMRGRELRLRGRAADAAMVMQTLAETPAFATVTAPQAITAVGNTGVEQFHLDIELEPADNAGDGS